MLNWISFIYLFHVKIAFQSKFHFISRFLVSIQLYLRQFYSNYCEEKLVLLNSKYLFAYKICLQLFVSKDEKKRKRKKIKWNHVVWFVVLKLFATLSKSFSIRLYFSIYIVAKSQKQRWREIENVWYDSKKEIFFDRNENIKTEHC